MALKVGIVGTSGVVGSLVFKILQNHPEFEPVVYKNDSVDLDAAIVAIPDSGQIVDFLYRSDVRVVDISPSYRLDDKFHKEWYGHARNDDLAKDPVIGLPELESHERIANAQLVVQPGCYTTAAVLALAPLANCFSEVVISAVEGASGAGKNGPSFIEIAENTYPYAVEGHRHQPEMEAILGQAVRFTPHLIPVKQGLLASCYLRGVDVLVNDVKNTYESFYANQPFIDIVHEAPKLNAVRETNECHIYPVVDNRHKVTVFAALDNLWKGAGGQAVQCLNIMHSIDEAVGL